MPVMVKTGLLKGFNMTKMQMEMNKTTKTALRTTVRCKWRTASVFHQCTEQNEMCIDVQDTLLNSG